MVTVLKRADQLVPGDVWVGVIHRLSAQWEVEEMRINRTCLAASAHPSSSRHHTHRLIMWESTFPDTGKILDSGTGAPANDIVFPIELK